MSWVSHLINRSLFPKFQVFQGSFSIPLSWEWGGSWDGELSPAGTECWHHFSLILLIKNSIKICFSPPHNSLQGLIHPWCKHIQCVLNFHTHLVSVYHILFTDLQWTLRPPQQYLRNVFTKILAHIPARLFLTETEGGKALERLSEDLSWSGRNCSMHHPKIEGGDVVTFIRKKKACSSRLSFYLQPWIHLPIYR